jgi:hypothetical protein
MSAYMTINYWLKCTNNMWWSVLNVVETGIDKNTTVNGHNCSLSPIFLYASFKTTFFQKIKHKSFLDKF